MGTEHNRDETFQIAVFVFAAAVAIFLAFVWKFSKYIGADFKLTLYATLESISLVILVLILWKAFRPRVETLIAFSLIPFWMFWWAVIDDIAGRLQTASGMLQPQSLPWYWSLLKYGPTIFFTVSWSALFLRKDKRYPL